MVTANLRTRILEVRGLYSNRTFIVRGGILMPVGNLLEDESSNLSRYNLSRKIGRNDLGDPFSFG